MAATARFVSRLPSAAESGARARHDPLHRHRRLDRAGGAARRRGLARAARTPPRDRPSRARAVPGRELDTAGDGFFAAFDGPARAVQAAAALRDPLRAIGIEVRAGLHTGECEVSDGKIVGIAVSIGARIASLAGPGEVLVSSTVKDLVAGSGLRFEDRGEHELKGIPDAWRLFALIG